MKNRRILVRHPAPYRTEGFGSYVLRLSEANGYPDPYRMLRDTSTNKTWDSLNVSTISRITNRTVEELRPIASSQRTQGKVKVLGHVLPLQIVNSRNCAVCPKCVQEKGFIEAHFAISLMTICPEHRSSVQICPGCKERLKWNRRGLLECGCGHHLEFREEEKISDAVVELLDIVRRKVLRLPRLSVCSTGLPLCALNAMSLKSLLFLIRSIGVRNIHSRERSRSLVGREMQVVEACAELLSNWPNNFRRTLAAATGPPAPSNPCTISKGSLSGYYLSILYGLGRTKDGDFIRRELIKHANDHFGLGTEDSKERAKILGGAQRYLTRNELATRLGVDRRFMNRILAAGSMKTIRVRGAGKRDRILIDVSDLAILKNSRGKVYNSTDAAAMIGIPRRILILLNDLGKFEMRYLPPGIRGYHGKDIERFRGRLLNGRKCSQDVVGAQPAISLGAFLAHGATDPMIKALVLSEICSGRVAIVRTNTRIVREIMLPQEPLKELVRTIEKPDWASLRQKSPNTNNGQAGVSMLQAAREIGCSSSVIPILIQKKMLRKSRGKGFSKWVCEKSIERFRSEFEPLSLVAKKARTNTQILTSTCDKLGITLLRTPLKGSPCLAFIRIRDIPRVLTGRFRVGVGDRHTRLRWKRLLEI